MKKNNLQKRKIKRKIKWNNVITMILIILFTISFVEHIKLNGLYFGLIVEVVMDTMITLTFRYCIKEMIKEGFHFSELFD